MYPAGSGHGLRRHHLDSPRPECAGSVRRLSSSGPPRPQRRQMKRAAGQSRGRRDSGDQGAGGVDEALSLGRLRDMGTWGSWSRAVVTARRNGQSQACGVSSSACERGAVWALPSPQPAAPRSPPASFVIHACRALLETSLYERIRSHAAASTQSHAGALGVHSTPLLG